jgi:hypothetical protein
MDRISGTGNETVQYRRLIWLGLFAIAMAQVEATIVVYLRDIYYGENPLEIFPLNIMSPRDLGIELVRETATIVMILSVALLAEAGFMRVFAAFVYVFGLWDIFYYVWLKLMIGWPQSWFEWDVLFLIPWPWFGPWITPALIALMFVVWGGRILTRQSAKRFTWVSTTLFVTGTLMALATFLLPGVPLLPGGTEAFRDYEPSDFSWGLFSVGYILMLIGLVQVSTSKSPGGQYSDTDGRPGR